MSESATPAASRSKLVVRILLLVVLLAAFVVALRWVKESGLMDRAFDWIKSLGPWGPVAFIAIYIVAVIFFVPASVFTLGAGFVYGMTWGSIWVLLAANIAAEITFLLGRYLARGWLEHRMEKFPRFKAIDEAVTREGWKIVALIRLAPVFPFSLMSYAFGLTRIPFWHYAAANLAMIPGTLMYVYFGSIGRAATEKKPLGVTIAILVLVVIVVLYITRVAKRALATKISTPESVFTQQTAEISIEQNTPKKPAKTYVIRAAISIGIGIVGITINYLLYGVKSTETENIAFKANCFLIGYGLIALVQAARAVSQNR